MTQDQLAHVFLAALLGFACWFALLGIGLLIAKLIEWTDDFEQKHPNPVLYIFARVRGWNYDPERMYPYWREGSDGDTDTDTSDEIVVQGMIIAPLLGALATATYYQVAIGIAVAVAAFTLFTMRFVKRLKKKFELHTADKNAHK